MKPYARRDGTSGVVAYRLGRGSITVQFVNGSIYRYDVRSAGAERIAEMQRRAEAGRGLSTYISQVVRDGYAEQLR